MTKTRIRYKQTNNLLVSTTFFPALKANVRVELDPTDLVFELVSVEDNEVVDFGSAKNIHLLKKAAKDCLVANGVIFEKEERERLEKIKVELKAEGVEA